jgi:hypothetical protein
MAVNKIHDFQFLCMQKKGKRGSRLYKFKRHKKPDSAQRRNKGSIWHDESDFLMCGIGSVARGSLNNKGAVVSEALVPFGQA